MRREQSHRIRTSRTRCLFAVLILTARIVGAEEPPATLPSVFRMPTIQSNYLRLMSQAIQQAQRGELAEAEKTCDQGIRLAPYIAEGYCILAAVQARAGESEAAFASLESAVERGYSDADRLQLDDNLKPLREDPRFLGLVKTARKGEKSPAPRAAEARLVADNVALVGESNTSWVANQMILHTLFRFDTNAPPREIILGHGEIGDTLRGWQKNGTAAGNTGDLYDNRDAGHSVMNYSEFPQLTRIEYAKEAIAARVHYGLQELIFHSGVVFGNSSTAQTESPYWRSQARSAYVDARAMAVLYSQYISNHLYVYPEHRDYKPGHNGEGGGHGDVFPVNTPYVIISQGSSGSDQPFLDGIACTLAAFRPDVKEFLAKSGTLMSTVQMIMRTCYQPAAKRVNYLTGEAHPPVFDGEAINVLNMVRLAHAMTRTNVPPMIQLRVVEEDHQVVGRDYFDGGNREVLFDTPCAIARVWRSTQYRRRIVISAEASRDLNDKPLTWHWVVLQGDADAIKIKPLNAAGSVVELLVSYHARRPIRPGAPLESNRVDIGAFVNNGTYYSAPGFVTFFSLDNEAREYDKDGRILSITYTGAEEKGNYVDPILDLPKDWRDEYHYDNKGRLTGWTRHRGEAHQEFTAKGNLIVSRDDEKKLIVARSVTYVPRQRGANQPPVLEQQVGETVLEHITED